MLRGEKCFLSAGSELVIQRIVWKEVNSDSLQVFVDSWMLPLVSQEVALPCVGQQTGFPTIEAALFFASISLAPLDSGKSG